MRYHFDFVMVFVIGVMVLDVVLKYLIRFFAEKTFKVFPTQNILHIDIKKRLMEYRL